jgi:hypothetical protein
MTNPEIQFLALRLLEKEALTADQLWLKASGLGPSRDIKTFRRALEDLEDFGVPIKKERTLFSIEPGPALCSGMLAFLRRAIDEHAAWRTVCRGDFDKQAISTMLAEKPRPVDLMWTLLDSSVNARRIEFLYEPQHVGTRENLKLVKSAFKIGTPPDRLPVSMIPHNLVFYGTHFLVLGESMIGSELQVRQYEVAGISEVTVRGMEQKQLQINPAELYEHSLRIWVGGNIHEVKLIDVTDSGERTQTLKVNGEDEILSYVLGSLGRFRIIDPPDEVRRRAEQLGLPEDMVFRFTGEGR